MSFEDELGAEIRDETSATRFAKEPEAAKSNRLFVSVSVLLLLIGGYFAWSLYPNIQIRLQKSQCVRAYATIRGIELALLKAQTDAGVEHFRDLLVDPSEFDTGPPAEQINRQTEFIYDLILHGKSAAINLKPEYRRRLSERYMNLENDPWGRRYLVYFPARRSEATEFEKSLLSLYGAPSDWTPKGARGLPNYCIFSAGKDGTLEIFSNKQSRGPVKNVLKFGDDVSNIHHFEIGW